MVPAGTSSLCEDSIGTWGAFCAPRCPGRCHEVILGGFGGPWRVLGGPLEGSESSPEGIWGCKKEKEREEESKTRKKRNKNKTEKQESEGTRAGKEDNKEKQKKLYIKKSKLPINRFSGPIFQLQTEYDRGYWRGALRPTSKMGRKFSLSYFHFLLRLV